MHPAIQPSDLGFFSANAAMTELIDQCEVLGPVMREVDPGDKRARTVQFTAAGREWLAAFGKAVKKAERELLKEIGPEAAEVLLQGLARYGGALESIRVAIP
jgi:DNA-binding MarR family transcriptional regulator